MLKLTKEQLQHLKSLNWLIDGPRATGRTTVLAHAFIAKAIRHPGEYVRVFDHVPETMPQNWMLDTVVQILESTDQAKDFIISHSKLAIKFK